MIGQNLRSVLAIILILNVSLALPLTTPAAPLPQAKSASDVTKTPIKHVVVIFQENESFDHYFGTYPNAANPPGETQFHARPGTPSVNGLSATLLQANPNGSTNLPFRLDRSQNYTCDMKHGYTAEQQAFDSGLMDMFPQFTAAPCAAKDYPTLASYGTRIVMGYYDGNTVTALWNYAQHSAMSDAFHGTNFGPSTVGAINLVSGMTGNVDLTADDSRGDLAHDVVHSVIIGDPDPYYDDCSTADRASLSGINIGDLLSEKHISWGWFQGGLRPSKPYSAATSTAPETLAVCGTLSDHRVDDKQPPAYVQHHEPFQYYKSTANPHHLPPANNDEIGNKGVANHQYDLADFREVLNKSAHLPAVTFLKATAGQNGHPWNSSPLDEQLFITDMINQLQGLPEWKSTLVIIAWDDSDGWYDHVLGPIVNQSAGPADALTSCDKCGTGANSLAGIQARCGYGPRLPLLLISGYAKENFVDNTITDQTSILNFIEYNWDLGPIGPGSFDAIAAPLTNMLDFSHFRPDHLILVPETGQPKSPQ